MGGDISKHGVEKAYARWAPIYDFVFGKVFEAGRNAAIEAAGKVCPPGGRLLEVGVGTGISLPGYPSNIRIVGMDLSEPMLRKAHERVVTQKLANVETLAVMDAMRMAV